MSLWLSVSILAYLFFGISSLCDKLVLDRKANNVKPIAFVFFVGVFGLFSILIIPFIKFGLPNYVGFLWLALDAIVHIIAIYTMYVAIQRFEVSRVIPTIIAAQSVFIFIIASIFWSSQIMLASDIIAFLILLAGGTLMSIDNSIKITGDYLKITTFSALMFALDYIFLKLIFSNQPFLQGVVWIMISIFIFGLVFLLRKKWRNEIFEKTVVFDKKKQMFFLGSQVCGGAGNLLQSFAISLAPVAFLAVVNSLKGIQFIFLFLLTLFLSYFYPKILKEEISRVVIFKKLLAIFLIAMGLAFLIL
jgi:drug/metabolite transporter (DMT)-like permease